MYVYIVSLQESLYDIRIVLQAEIGAGAVSAAHTNTGLGTQQSLDFLYAWNQLAPHLPLQVRTLACHVSVIHQSSRSPQHGVFDQ